MFEYPPIWLSICVTETQYSTFVNAWGYNYSNSFGLYDRTGNLVCYAQAKYSDKWGIGKVNVPYSGDNTYPFGKKINNTYYWYSSISESAQFNDTNYTYYWICLEYNQ